MKTLDQKLARIRAGHATRKDFIIADAKDADMAFGLAAPGPKVAGEPGRGFRTLNDYRSQIRAVVDQAVVDLVLLSVSNLENLAMQEGIFRGSPVTPAARANDTTEVWAVRHGSYSGEPSRPFRTALIDHIKSGKLVDDPDQTVTGADLGLYSITFNNRLDRDYESLRAFHEFRREAERKHFRYFLEVFNPNVDPGFPPEAVGEFLNDNIIRCLAGVPECARPVFLKIPYNGPRAMEELASYDDSLIVGILGGGAGTTRDAFQLIHDAQKYGARVALFGRKINLSEHPLAFIKCLRAVTDGDLGPAEAVRFYHHELEEAGLTPIRPLSDDLRPTEEALLSS